MDGVEVRHLVGAIANEGDINNRYIGHIKLYDDYSTIELPQGMPKELLQLFKKTRVMNKSMQMSLIEQVGDSYEDNGYSRRKGRSSQNDRTFSRQVRRDSQQGDRKFKEKLLHFP